MAAHERTKKYTKFLSTSSGDYKLEKCNQCEFSTPHAANLNKHMIQHGLGEEKDPTNVINVVTHPIKQTI